MSAWQPLRLKPAYMRVAILLLAVILNFFQIDRASLWNDEGFSFFVAQDGLAHTLRLIADDTQPPFYYLTLSLWLGLGTSVFVIRALSATAMTLAVLPLYGAAKRLFDEHVAVLASCLFVIAPLDLGWAQKARPYPLQILLVACAFWGFVRVWRADDQIIGAGLIKAFRQHTIRSASTDFSWLAYAVGGALAMLAQAPAGFFLLGCNLVMAVSICLDLKQNRILLLNWIIAQIVLVVIWMLWLPAFLHQIAAHLTAAQIATKHAIFLVNFHQVLGILSGLFAIAGLWRLGPIFVPIYAVLVCSAINRIIRRRPQAWPLIAVIVVPIATCLAGYFLIHPIFGYVIYTFAWIEVPYTILIALGILSLRPKRLQVCMLALVVTGNLWGLKNVYQTDTPPLDRVAATLQGNVLPGDGIVLSATTSGRWGITYYLGPPYGALPGLGIQETNGDGLIKTLPQVKLLHRVWIIVPDGEPPAIDLTAQWPGLQPSFVKQVGSFQITRFEVPPS